MKWTQPFLMSILLLTGLSIGTARAATWDVPGDYPTIQAAISAVTTVNGDIIVVAPVGEVRDVKSAT